MTRLPNGKPPPKISIQKKGGGGGGGGGHRHENLLRKDTPHESNKTI